MPLRYDRRRRRDHQGSALTRHAATDEATRIGSLFVNPGGPGGSGIESVHFLVEELPEVVKARFDLVGFDPGVSASRRRSTRMGDQAKDAEARPRPDAGHPRRDHRADRPGGSHGRRVRQAQGELLPYVGTANGGATSTGCGRRWATIRSPTSATGYGTILGAIYAGPVPGQASGPWC